MYKGQIQGFPKEVVDKMLERQFEHRGTKDVSVFEKDIFQGFMWLNTSEGGGFWAEVIYKKNFDLFFQKYPKETETLDSLVEKIIQWGEERNFYGEGGATIHSQTLKLSEELGELSKNVLRGRDTKDDLGDLAVVLVAIAKLSGTTLLECLKVAYNDIKDREGKFVNGTFIKKADLN